MRSPELSAPGAIWKVLYCTRDYKVEMYRQLFNGCYTSHVQADTVLSNFPVDGASSSVNSANNYIANSHAPPPQGFLWQSSVPQTTSCSFPSENKVLSRSKNEPTTLASEQIFSWYWPRLSKLISISCSQKPLSG
jgi:hypothetical protein